MSVGHTPELLVQALADTSLHRTVRRFGAGSGRGGQNFLEEFRGDRASQTETPYLETSR